MPKSIDLIGKRYGRLIVQEKVKNNKKGDTWWLCCCDCGNHITAKAGSLNSGGIKSCGCLRRERVVQANTIDITGQRFGKLVAIRPLRKNNRIYWECKCDCGNTVVVYGTNLRNGHTNSCGCIHRKYNSESKTHLYMHYALMKARCSPKYHYRKSYYDKGIKICDEWLRKDDGYYRFKNWALNNGYQDGLTLDRINNDGDYEPSNCRWTTVKEQANNRSSNRYYEYKGLRKTLNKWSECLGISYSTLVQRQKRGIKPPELFDKTNLRTVLKI